MSGILQTLMAAGGSIIFPTVVTTNTGTDVTAAAATATVQLPSGIVSGDLLLILGGFNQAVNTFAATGWTNLYAGSARTQALYRIATGAEGATITVTWGGISTVRFMSLRINQWHGSGAPEVAGQSSGNSTAPDSPSLTPSWGAANTLWITHCGFASGAASTLSAFPANYVSNQYTALNGNTTVSHIGVATKNLNAATEDPGAFTINSNSSWAAGTIAVQP